MTQIFASGPELIRFNPIIIVSGKVTGGGLNWTPLTELGLSFGLNAEQVNSCIQSEAGIARAERLLRIEPWRFQITGFPTLILNGQMLDSRDRAIVTFAGLARTIDAEIQNGD